jgi:hypothetical protein
VSTLQNFLKPETDMFSDLTTMNIKVTEMTIKLIKEINTLFNQTKPMRIV